MRKESRVLYFSHMNIHFFERSLRIAFGVLCFVAAAYVFTTPVARAIAVVVGGYFVLVEGILGVCGMYHAVGLKMGKDVLPKEVVYVFGMLGVQAVLAYEWLMAGWEKIHGGMFVGGMEKSLTAFASKNPLAWVQDFLLSVAVPNAALFGQLVQWGELLLGIGLIVFMLVFLLAPQSIKRMAVAGMIMTLKSGAFLNAVFYLAAGWMSPSTHGLNVVMFWVQVALAWAWGYHLWSVPSHQQLIVRRG